MGTDRNIKIQRPTGRKLLLLLPFAVCYACFVVLGDWQGSVDYSNAQNLGRLVLGGGKLRRTAWGGLPFRELGGVDCSYAFRHARVL